MTEATPMTDELAALREQQQTLEGLLGRFVDEISEPCIKFGPHDLCPEGEACIYLVSRRILGLPRMSYGTDEEARAALEVQLL